MYISCLSQPLALTAASLSLRSHSRQNSLSIALLAVSDGSVIFCILIYIEPKQVSVLLGSGAVARSSGLNKDSDDVVVNQMANWNLKATGSRSRRRRGRQWSEWNDWLTVVGKVHELDQSMQCLTAAVFLPSEERTLLDRVMDLEKGLSAMRDTSGLNEKSTSKKTRQDLPEETCKDGRLMEILIGRVLNV